MESVNQKHIYVEKKAEFAYAVRRLYRSLTEKLDMHTVASVRVLRCFVLDGISSPKADADLVTSMLVDPRTEIAVDEESVLTYAKRADVTSICVMPLFARPVERLMEDALRIGLDRQYGEKATADTPKEREFFLRAADVFLIEGQISDRQKENLRTMLVNPASVIELSLFSLSALPPISLRFDDDILPIRGFRSMDTEALTALAVRENLRMSEDDLLFIQSYFRIDEKRDPNRFELRMMDTYWSDHCRHITFLTALQDLTIEDRDISEAFELYLRTRESLYGVRPKNVTLMDIATLPARYFIREDRMPQYYETGENNAFTIRVEAQTAKGTEPWLLHFKNETHNYSTEMEPYLGAFSSFGATISDPLSARAEVFAAIRLSGQAPFMNDQKILQRERIRNAFMAHATADGFAAFGTQSGIPTGLVHEWLHPGFAAKHMEVCFTAAAAPEKTFFASRPIAGDVVILIGAKTGRDGLGGGLHSSKARAKMHDITDAETGTFHIPYTAQIGDPLAARALLRMMRRKDVIKLVKRANDVASGGIAVAAAELANGLRIDLERVPVSALDRISMERMIDPYEIAFSETQARMVVVVSANHANEFIDIADEENLQAEMIGIVTEEPRFRLLYCERSLLSLSRAFLNSTGAERQIGAFIPSSQIDDLYRTITDRLMMEDLSKMYLRVMLHPEVAAQKNLSQRFDSTAGGRSVVLPFGGSRMLTPMSYTAFRFPVESMETDPVHTCAVFSYGYQPTYAEQSPYHGAYLSVLQTICRMTAAGIPFERITLSLQEFFPSVDSDSKRFGVPLAAMLGAFRAQMDYGVAAAGGKDSMNGSSTLGDVPPTVIAFGVAVTEQEMLLTPEFKKAGSRVYLLTPAYLENRLPDPEDEKSLLSYLMTLHRRGKLHSCMAVSSGGIAAAVAQMCFGNQIGFNFECPLSAHMLFDDRPGAFLVETDEELRGTLLGHTKDVANILLGNTTIPLNLLSGAWQKTQEKLYPTETNADAQGIVAAFPYHGHSRSYPTVVVSHPKVLLPILPYTTGEDLLASRFTQNGIEPIRMLFRCRTSEETERSVEQFRKLLEQTQLLAFGGGGLPDYSSFSALSGASGAYARALFSIPAMQDALMHFSERSETLTLGLGEGFRILLEAGLLSDIPYRGTEGDLFSLTENPCGHSVSQMVRTRVMSVASPWMRYSAVGDIYTLPVSSCAGRCSVSDELVLWLGEHGLIASQYIDSDNNPTMEVQYNPLGSDFAIEGVFSKNGRVFARMAHCDRVDNSLAINVPANKEQSIFRAAADFYKIKL